MPYVTTRRNFLYGGAATALGFWLRRAEAFAQGAAAPKRFLVVHHPVGTVRDNWLCKGSETDFTLSRILMPFEPVKMHMAILDGIDIIARGAGGGHEQGTVTLMTGVRTKNLYPGNGGDDPKSEGPSVDQMFLKMSPGLQGTPIASLQVSCDDRVDVAEISTRRLSYSGAAQPMEPYLVPQLTYQRVFGTVMSNSMGTMDVEAMTRARMLKKSVLDFALGDLKKLRTLAPSAEYDRLDAHEAAIRELEQGMDAAPTGGPQACGLEMEPPMTKAFTDSAANRIGNGNYETSTGEVGEQDTHKQIGELHFAVIKAAFQCDLTRVVTFQWSPGTNHVSFQGFYPPDDKAVKMHHPLSHEFNNPQGPEFLTRIDTWYSERVSTMIQQLKATPDGAGTLLDSTLVPYVTEVARADHSYDNTPFIVFGGANTKLKQGGVFKKHNPSRPVNDMWLTCAKSLDVPMTSLGGSDMSTGPLDILVP